jgi:hypothetical protein
VHAILSCNGAIMQNVQARAANLELLSIAVISGSRGGDDMLVFVISWDGSPYYTIEMLVVSGASCAAENHSTHPLDDCWVITFVVPVLQSGI